MTNQLNQIETVAVNHGTPEYWAKTKTAFSAIRRFDRLVSDMNNISPYKHSGSYDEHGDPIAEENSEPIYDVVGMANELLACDRAVEVLEANGRLAEVVRATKLK